jgi:hypothetical protein
MKYIRILQEKKNPIVSYEDLSWEWQIAKVGWKSTQAAHWMTSLCLGSKNLTFLESDLKYLLVVGTLMSKIFATK